MCGIAGFLRLDGSPLDRDAAVRDLKRMTDAIAHRGPDSDGFFVDGPVALGHRRLSIIDLGGGHQPMGNEDGSVQIVFNGEIYEFKAVREQLERAGHRFHSNCDTEAIVHAYEEWGAGCLPHLHGMFAWAVWDGNRRHLFLARDRMGKKPLYHAVSDGLLLFASELKALLAHPAVSRRLRLEALRAFLSFEYVPAPMSIYEGIHKMEPGHFAEIVVGDGNSAGIGGAGLRAKSSGAGALPPAAGRRETTAGTILVSPEAAARASLEWSRAGAVGAEGKGPAAVAGEAVAKSGALPTRLYWDIAYPRVPYGGSSAEAAEELLGKLRGAVGRRLVSDVPLGVFLSGGIDSSTIVALMRDFREAKDIHTFSIAFEEKSFDESSHARLVARAFGTTHQEERLPARRLLEILPEIAQTLDEPFADPSFVPTLLLSKFTRRNVTVALGGDGGDELFAGYDPFLAHDAAKLVGWLPPQAIRALRRAANLLPVSTENVSFDFKVKKFLEGLPYPASKRHFAWLGSFEPPLHGRLLRGSVWRECAEADPYQRIDTYLRQLGRGRGSQSLNPILYLYAKLYMQDGILVKVDRATMAASLEARAPFLDTDVVEFAGQLPASWKLHGWGPRAKTKWILKQAVAEKVPMEIILRPKKGFGIPIAAWFRGPLKGEGRRLFDTARLKRQGLFDPATVQRYWKEHVSGRQNHAKRLWTLLCFQQWWDHFGPEA